MLKFPTHLHVLVGVSTILNCLGTCHAVVTCTVDAAIGLIQVRKKLAYICHHCATVLVNSFCWWGSRNLGDFNFSVHWTEDWKTANITPIYKSYEIKMAENYCPVSLTSIIVKTLENLVHIHIVRFLRDHSLLSGNQHCFRWLLQLLHDWLRFNHLDKPSPVDVVFLDCQIVCQCLILISFTNLINMELRDSHFAG